MHSTVLEGSEANIVSIPMGLGSHCIFISIRKIRHYKCRFSNEYTSLIFDLKDIPYLQQDVFWFDITVKYAISDDRKSQCHSPQKH